MRRRKTSVLISTAVFVLLSVLYLTVPQDPFSGAMQRVVFGLDNRLSGRQSSPADNPEAANRIAELEAENARLQAELGFGVSYQYQTTAARVVSKNIQNYRATIDIDVGEDSGVTPGQAVVARGQLIGRVAEVFGNRARVLTLSDPDFRAAAVLENTNTEGLVRHVPGGVILEQVPSGLVENPMNQRVVTSGLGGVFPPGLLIGTLSDDISPDNAIFREYVLNATVGIAGLQEVLVIR